MAARFSGEILNRSVTSVPREWGITQCCQLISCLKIFTHKIKDMLGSSTCIYFDDGNIMFDGNTFGV